MFTTVIWKQLVSGDAGMESKPLFNCFEMQFSALITG